MLADQEARKRFRNEALALSKLNHPNIGTIHDFDSQGDLDFLVMECVPGETLRGKISAGPLPERKTIRLAVQVANGLIAAHEQGLVHRDLKPENVRLTRNDRPKILDFGIAKLIRPSSDLRTTVTNNEGVRLKKRRGAISHDLLRYCSVLVDGWTVVSRRKERRPE
jgi:eukaryotic-like serine/threonine-protein kinase